MTVYDCLDKEKYKNNKYFKYYDEEYTEHFCNEGVDRKAKLCQSLLYKPIGSVLDIGCGDAAFLKEFKNISKVVGTDISLPLLKKAQQNIPLADFYRADSKELPFKDREFDVAVLVDVLEHLESPEKTLKEASRVTNRILIKVPLEDNLFQNLYKAFVNVNWRHVQGHINAWNSSSFEKFIKKNNLIIIEKYIPKAKMVKQLNWRLFLMNVWQCMVEIFPDSIKTKLAPSEYYCVCQKS